MLNQEKMEADILPDICKPLLVHFHVTAPELVRIVDILKLVLVWLWLNWNAINEQIHVKVWKFSDKQGKQLLHLQREFWSLKLEEDTNAEATSALHCDNIRLKHIRRFVGHSHYNPRVKLTTFETTNVELLRKMEGESYTVIS